MLRLYNTIKAWGSPAFNDSLKTEIEQLNAEHLPLQQGLTRSNYAMDNKIEAMILNVADDNQFIHAKVGIFYSGIIAGCNCADDPTPVEEQNEYCEVQFVINKQTAETSVMLLES